MMRVLIRGEALWVIIICDGKHFIAMIYNMTFSLSWTFYHNY